MKNRTTMTTTGPESGKPKGVMVEPRVSPAVDARNANLIKKQEFDALKARLMNESAKIGMKSMREGFQESVDAQNAYYNGIPFKNKAIDLLRRKKYDISREFDGQEVQGTVTERPTMTGGMVATERFNMPGGGSRMERTRFNSEGMPIRRVIKDKKINR
jgi:hypothetical protein